MKFEIKPPKEAPHNQIQGETPPSD